MAGEVAVEPQKKDAIDAPPVDAEFGAFKDPWCQSGELNAIDADSVGHSQTDQEVDRQILDRFKNNTRTCDYPDDTLLAVAINMNSLKISTPKVLADLCLYLVEKGYPRHVAEFVNQIGDQSQRANYCLLVARTAKDDDRVGTFVKHIHDWKLSDRSVRAEVIGAFSERALEKEAVKLFSNWRRYDRPCNDVVPVLNKYIVNANDNALDELITQDLIPEQCVANAESWKRLADRLLSEEFLEKNSSTDYVFHMARIRAACETFPRREVTALDILDGELEKRRTDDLTKRPHFNALTNLRALDLPLKFGHFRNILEIPLKTINLIISSGREYGSDVQKFLYQVVQPNAHLSLVHDALPAIIQKAAAPDSGPKNTEEILRTLSVELALFQGDLFSAAVLAEAINNIGDIKIRGEAHLAVLDACKDDQSWRGDFTARASFAGYEDTELIVKLLVKSLDTGRCAFTSFIADLKVRKPEIAQMRSPGDDLSVMDKIEEQSWLNDVSAALRYFKIPPTHVLTSDGKWNELLKSSLRKSGKIETALVLTEKRANYFLANNRIQPYPRSLRERLTSLMKPLHEVLQEENLDSTRSGLLTLAERLIVGHAIPNDEILSSMHCLGPKTREMMITIFDSCGTQYGRNVLDALSQTFPDSKELSQNQIKAVKALIETGFRGVSGETLQRFIRAYDDSPPLATLMVQLWKRAARIFTSPRSVPPDVKKDPLYAELLATAYRPGNSYFTMTTLRKYLDKAVDHDEHLKPYTFPREGWRLNLVATSESSSSQRVTEPEELVRRCFALLSDPAPINFEELGLKVLSGHFKDAPVEAVVGRLLYDYAPEELKRIQTEIAAAPDAAKRLSLLKELAEDSVAQAIDCCAEALTEKITLSKKVTKQVMTLLQFKKEREIDKGDLKKALVFGLNKVVDSLRKDITRRTKLSAQEGESLEDPILLLTKCDHSFFGRGAAALCTVEDVWSWNSDQYLQMNLLVPAEGRIYGNVQLNLFLDPENRPSIMARINISQNYKVATLAATVDAILGHFRTFARDNNLIAYVPENNCIVNLASNNGLIRDRMEAYWGKLHEVTVQVAEKEDYTVRKVHELLDEPLPPS